MRDNLSPFQRAPTFPYHIRHQVLPLHADSLSMPQVLPACPSTLFAARAPSSLPRGVQLLKPDPPIFPTQPRDIHTATAMPQTSSQPGRPDLPKDWAVLLQVITGKLLPWQPCDWGDGFFANPNAIKNGAKEGEGEMAV